MTQAPGTVPPPSGGGLQPHRGVLILVFGILSLVMCCFPFGIAAWIMGNGDLAAMRAGVKDPSGEGLVKAGKICGMIGTFLSIAYILLNVILLAIGVAIPFAGAGTGGP